MAIDTYLIKNQKLTDLVLKDVRMNQDLLKIIAGTVETSRSLKRFDLSQNMLKNGGAKEVGKIINRNTSLFKLNISQNLIKEEGLAALLDSLTSNTTITELICEGQKFAVSRGVLSLIANLVCF